MYIVYNVHNQYIYMYIRKDEKDIRREFDGNSNILNTCMLSIYSVLHLQQIVSLVVSEN